MTTSVPGMSARELIQRMEENATRERAEEDRRGSPFAMGSALAASLVGLPGLFILIIGAYLVFDGADGIVAVAALGIGFLLAFVGAILGALASATRKSRPARSS